MVYRSIRNTLNPDTVTNCSNCGVSFKVLKAVLTRGMSSESTTKNIRIIAGGSGFGMLIAGFLLGLPAFFGLIELSSNTSLP